MFTQLYAQLTEVPSGDSEYAQFMKEAQRMYEKSLESLPGPEPPDEYKGITTKNKDFSFCLNFLLLYTAYPALQDSLVHRTFLEELVFWTVKFEFPQKLVCLLLNMLPDPDYKVNLLFFMENAVTNFLHFRKHLHVPLCYIMHGYPACWWDHQILIHLAIVLYMSVFSYSAMKNWLQKWRKNSISCM